MYPHLKIHQVTLTPGQKKRIFSLQASRSWLTCLLPVELSAKGVIQK
jgi:hypothetical protein